MPYSYGMAVGDRTDSETSPEGVTEMPFIGRG